jgi:serine protease inhibitor
LRYLYKRHKPIYHIIQDEICTQQESSGNVTIEFANGAFLKEGYEVKPQFKNVLEQDFQSTVDTARFSNPTAAAGQINSWVADHTHNKIQNVLLPGKGTSLSSVKRTSRNG